jgi:tripartite-type tricarboxylate transporter receptor subunit TctC
MKKLSVKRLLRFGIYVALILLLSAMITGCAPKTQPQDVSGEKKSAEEVVREKEEAAAFYKGKIITFIVPYKAGGGYDTNARLLAPYLEKYTGATVVIKNVEGGGGMLGVNELYLARPDGLTMGIQNAVACVTNQLAEIEGVAYDLLKFGWIGRLTTDNRVLAMRSDFPNKTFDEMLKSGKTVRIGATGLGGSTYVDAVITTYALDIPTELIHGYDSSREIDMGMLRGEIDGCWGSYASRLSMLNAGEQFIILQSGEKRAPEMPDVPTWFEVAKTEKARAIITVLEANHAVGRTVALPPGVPEGRLAFLREAFQQAVNDSGFLEDMKKADRPVDYVDYEEIKKLFEKALVMPEDINEIFVKAVKGEI